MRADSVKLSIYCCLNLSSSCESNTEKRLIYFGGKVQGHLFSKREFKALGKSKNFAEFAFGKSEKHF